MVSATDSPRPIWLVDASSTSGLPPSSAMPTANDTRVRVEALSKITATVCGPSQRALGVRVLLERVGEVEDLGLLGR